MSKVLRIFAKGILCLVVVLAACGPSNHKQSKKKVSFQKVIHLKGKGYYYKDHDNSYWLYLIPDDGEMVSTRTPAIFGGSWSRVSEQEFEQSYVHDIDPSGLPMEVETNAIGAPISETLEPADYFEAQTEADMGDYEGGSNDANTSNDPGTSDPGSSDPGADAGDGGGGGE